MSISLSERQRRQIDAALAPVMFGLGLAFLVGVSILVVLWFDMRSMDVRGGELEAVVVRTPTWLETITVDLLFLLWPAFFIELIYHWAIRPWDSPRYRLAHFQSLMCCVFPPLRIGATNPDLGGRLWLPKLGWRRSDRRLSRRMEGVFGRPMLVIALMILPVLIVEFTMRDQVAAHRWLRYSLHFCTGVIWFAFAAEFIVMVSVAERKLQYCKTNWIDLAIILLPFVSFLRSLRIVRATRLASLAPAQQLLKVARVYRLRATALKLLRALLLLEMVHRVLRITPERKLARLRKHEHELCRELAHIREQIAEVELRRDRELAASASAELSSNVTDSGR